MFTGEFLNGPVGYDTVAIGGLSVTNQTLPLVNYSYWNGDGKGFCYLRDYRHED